MDKKLYTPNEANLLSKTALANHQNTEVNGCADIMLSQEAHRLEYIKVNLSIKTNNELAKDLGMSFGSLRWLMRRNRITRNEEQYRSLRKEMGKNQIGEANANWRGGIQNNFMRYKRIQIERYEQHVKARIIAHRALRKGVLKREPCEICGDPKTQFHHENYEEPLKVLNLCIRHHKLADKYLKIGIKFKDIKNLVREFNTKKVA